MRKIGLLVMLSMMFTITACGTKEKPSHNSENKVPVEETEKQEKEDSSADGIIEIELSDQEILVEGEKISENEDSAVYRANDIIFYLEGQGITYGEGETADEHSQAEADAHTVVHITKPGTYEITGTMEAGQIFVDLGDGAKKDPEAVVNLILDNTDLTCTVAPAIFFYRVYECGDKDEENASMEVDLKNAGANITLADDSKNHIYGSYVAKIYESCELSEDGTEVIDSEKLHKYDAAVYSKMSMNIFGDTGKMNIKAENEGLDTELHLAIEGGHISIESGNDGINVNEDNVSVFSMNGGSLNITVDGATGEGDGIDSNGWLIINGGTVNTSSCAFSMDAGIDADCGIYINGGKVSAGGNMNAEIAGGTQRSVSFMAKARLEGSKTYQVKDSDGSTVLEISPENDFSMLVVSDECINKDGAYSLWLGNELAAQEMEAGMGGHGRNPEGFPEGMEPPEGFQGEFPEGMEPPEGFRGEFPEGMEPPEGFHGELPEGVAPPDKKTE